MISENTCTRREFLAATAGARVWDANGNQSDIDLKRMMKIVVDAGWRGHCGIEYRPEGKELEGVVDLRKQLEAVRLELSTGRR
jgi:hypothetical protein